MEVLVHHIYEYEKGLRNLILHTTSATNREKIEEQKSLYEKELELLQNNFDALLQKSFQE